MDSNADVRFQASTVKDSRVTEDNTAIRRRRLCLKCGARATTFERFGRVEDRDAAAQGADLQLALVHRVGAPAPANRKPDLPDCRRRQAHTRRRRGRRCERVRTSGQPTKPLREATAPRRGLSRLESAVYVGLSINRFDELVRSSRMPPPRTVDSVQVGQARTRYLLTPCRATPESAVEIPDDPNRPVLLHLRRLPKINRAVRIDPTTTCLEV